MVFLEMIERPGGLALLLEEADEFEVALSGRFLMPDFSAWASARVSHSSAASTSPRIIIARPQLMDPTVRS